VRRVMCDFCRSEHNYRGGGEAEPPAAGARAPEGPTAAGPPSASAALPLVRERERTELRMTASESGDDLERLLRRVLRQELGLTAVVPADKWRGGELVLRPGRPGLQEKKWPIDTFFHKIVIVRNRLRTKVRLQSYISGCYGTLTSFNVLFADEEDQFKGAGGD